MTDVFLLYKVFAIFILKGKQNASRLCLENNRVVLLRKALIRSSYSEINLFNNDRFYEIFSELATTKLHTLLLDHHKIKLSWLIDWNKKEVMFNVDNAFSAKNKWFSFGFSKRGDIEHSDLCFFTKENDIFDIAVVSWICSQFINPKFISGFF